jgi:hypothetical protein
MQKGDNIMSNIAEGIEQKALEKGILIGEKRAEERAEKRGEERGLATGNLERAKIVALNMFEHGEPLEKIVQYTEFPIEVIQSWIKE